MESFTRFPLTSKTFGLKSTPRRRRQSTCSRFKRWQGREEKRDQDDCLFAEKYLFPREKESLGVFIHTSMECKQSIPMVGPWSGSKLSSVNRSSKLEREDDI